LTTALPTQVTYGTFKGKLIDAINTGAGEVSQAVTGTVTASPAVNSVNIPAALVVMLPRPVTVTLDANGAFTMQLVATDDPALSVLNWAYQISFQLGNGDALAPFLVQIPGGSTVDLSTANPVSTGGGVAITQGPPGPPGASVPDTGWRVLTSWTSTGVVTGTALPAGCAPTAGKAGSVQIRRVGGEVQWSFGGCTWSGQANFAMPAGFAASAPFGMVATSFSGQVNGDILCTGVGLFIGIPNLIAGNNLSNATPNGTMLRYNTLNAWPTVLPGTPA